MFVQFAGGVFADLLGRHGTQYTLGRPSWRVPRAPFDPSGGEMEQARFHASQTDGGKALLRSRLPISGCINPWWGGSRVTHRPCFCHETAHCLRQRV